MRQMNNSDESRSSDLSLALQEVADEVARARLAYPGFTSAHEGYAVILEEVDELWSEVKKRPRRRDTTAMRLEAVQIAAMAVCFIIDLLSQRTQSAASQETPTQAARETRAATRAARTGTDQTQIQADFETFRLAYPASRRIGGTVGYRAFARATFDSLAQLLLALEQHKRSEQWQTPKLIPLMTTWLHQERWNQTLPEPTLPARHRIGAGRFATVPDGEPL